MTCYQHFHDPNNWWRVEDARIPYDHGKSGNKDQAYRPVKHGDVIRLVHVATGLPMNRSEERHLP